MHTGMLWFDNDPKTELPAKIERAADYYRKKYGKTPNICLVNPRMLSNEKTKAGRVELRPSPVILPNHLWLGVDNGQDEI